MESKKRIIDNTKLEGNQKLYKYMDLEKFLSLIIRSEICFCNQSGLKNIDPYEGAMTKSELLQEAIVKNIMKDIKQSARFKKINIKNGDTHLSIDKDEFDKYRIYNDSIYYIDCWHINENESLAMWKVFSNNKNSIAINTTKEKLINSIINDNKDIYLKEVEYDNLFSDEAEFSNPIKTIQLVNNETLHIESGDQFSWSVETGLLRKAKYYEYEKELRLYFKDKDNAELTKFIKMDLSNMIDEIIISPNCDEWFLTILNDILKKYDLNIKVKFSDIRQSNVALSKEELRIAEYIVENMTFNKDKE